MSQADELNEELERLLGNMKHVEGWMLFLKRALEYDRVAEENVRLKETIRKLEAEINQLKWKIFNRELLDKS